MKPTYLIEFTVPGQPVGKGRPRFTRAGHAYTPAKTASYENLVRLEFNHQFPSFEPFDGAICVEIMAYYQIPSSFSRKRHSEAKNHIIRPTVRPDCDNVCKAVLDALNNVAYHDDNQIVTLKACKLYDDKPRTEITIWKWNP